MRAKGRTFRHRRITSVSSPIEGLLQSRIQPAPDRKRVGKHEARQDGRGPERVGFVNHLGKLPRDERRTGQRVGKAGHGGRSRSHADEPLRRWILSLGDILDLMRQLVREGRKTMVMVTHEVRFALEVADKVLLLDSGRVVEQGSPHKVFADPDTALGKLYGRLLH